MKKTDAFSVFASVNFEPCVLDTTLCDKVRLLLATGQWFSPPIKSTYCWKWH